MLDVNVRSNTFLLKKTVKYILQTKINILMLISMRRTATKIHDPSFMAGVHLPQGQNHNEQVRGFSASSQ